MLVKTALVRDRDFTMQPVLHVRAFDDNYIWVIRGQAGDRALLVDPGDAAPVLTELRRLGLAPAGILCTHHHGDHTGGIGDLVRRFPGLPVYGPATESIPGVTHPLHGGETVEAPALGLTFTVLAVPGHTLGHLAYYGHGWLFCGDTLFQCGCGRLFEGTPTQMQRSLSTLAALPAETLVYCAHEYTLYNTPFAAAVEPENPSIHAWHREAQGRRARGEPTVPTTLAHELDTNPFLRTGRNSVRAAAERHAGSTLPDDAAVFAALRGWRDNFRG
jgi:hydroxyacylglutathione hydrolase